MERIRDVLWGAPTLVLLLGFGLYFTFKCGFFAPSALFSVFKGTFFAPRKKGGGGNLSSFAALATALGGTVGVGSISGVSLAIAVGGAGSVFWMWVCSFLGMGLKYAEVALAHKGRIYKDDTYRGGAMYCLRGLGYKKTAAFFAVVTLCAAVAGGSVVQAGALSRVMGGFIPSPYTRALLTALITLLIIWGGRKSISRFNALVLPTVALLFILCCMGIILARLDRMPQVFARIFGDALGLRQAAGGVGGAMMIRVGCVRGTFSHEAGMGSSPISYAAGAEEDSHTQGLWGVSEVFIDSFVVSTLTAFAVLALDIDSVDRAFAACYGKAGAVFYGVALGLFALGAIISWCFYGEEALYYLCPGGRAVFSLFKIAVALGAAAGALMTEGGAFALADIWGVLMLVPNIFLLYRCRSDIVAVAKQKRK